MESAVLSAASALTLMRLLFALGATVAASLLHVMWTSNAYLSGGVRHLQADSSLYTPLAQKDLIRNLPGLNFKPSFRQFSGYLTVSEENNRKIFYWYVESQGDPENDPVVFWTNGGPGCSGLLGFGTEHGPFFIDQNGNLSPNSYSWNKVANMLYVEQPAGVGFSYSDNPKDYMTGDHKAAIDNFILLRQFFERYPERKSNDFYIASESYGGHYIPQLTLELMMRNTNGAINFKGFIVGNPYVDPFSNMVTRYEAFYSHGLLAKPLYEQWHNECTNRDSYEPTKCMIFEVALFQEFGNGINPYAMDFPICTEEDATSYETEVPDERGVFSMLPGHLPSSQGERLLQKVGNGRKQLAQNIHNGPSFLPPSDRYRPCAELYFENYLNRRDVQKAIHATPAGVDWSVCSDKLKYSYEDRETPQMSLYSQIIGSIQTNPQYSDFKMLVFSGDDDSICSTAGTQSWIYDLGVVPIMEKLWKPWQVDGQTAGFVTEFDLKGKGEGSFHFVTVHGAGHEVPAYRPKEALHLFRLFFRGEWYD